MKKNGINYQMKDDSFFKDKDKEHYERWVNQIREYVDKDNEFEYNEDFIIKLALSYTLQSLRNNESLKRFQWSNEESNMSEPDYYNMNGLSPNGAFEQGLISKDEYVGFIKGNVIKYVVRCDKKGNGVEDIDKAINYLKLLKNEIK